MSNTAQEARQRRVKKVEAVLEEKVDEIFNSFVALMDEDTEKGYYGSLIVVLLETQSTIQVMRHQTAYPIFGYPRRTLFKMLSHRINREPGFSANVDYNGIHNGAQAITMVVSIQD